MSLTSTTSAMCNTMVTSFDALVNPIRSAKGDIVNAKNKMINMLNNMQFSPDLDTITDAAQGMVAIVSSITPGDSMADMESLKSFIDDCLFYQGKNPAEGLLGTLESIAWIIGDLIDSINVPEFKVGDIGSLINSILNGADFGLPGGLNISDLFKSADQLIQCLSSVCGAGNVDYIEKATEYATTLNDLYSDMNIVSDPTNPNYAQFDFDAIYNQVGMNVQETLQVNEAMKSIEKIKVGANEAVNRSIQKVGQLTAEGYF